jgi:hypothetical protein
MYALATTTISQSDIKVVGEAKVTLMQTHYSVILIAVILL